MGSREEFIYKIEHTETSNNTDHLKIRPNLSYVQLLASLLRLDIVCPLPKFWDEITNKFNSGLISEQQMPSPIESKKWYSVSDVQKRDKFFEQITFAHHCGKLERYIELLNQHCIKCFRLES